MWKSELTTGVLGLSTGMPHAKVLEDDAYEEGYCKDNEDAGNCGQVDIVVPVGWGGLRKQRRGSKVGGPGEGWRSWERIGTVEGGRGRCKAI